MNVDWDFAALLTSLHTAISWRSLVFYFVVNQSTA